MNAIKNEPDKLLDLMELVLLNDHPESVNLRKTTFINIYITTLTQFFVEKSDEKLEYAIKKFISLLKRDSLKEILKVCL